MEDTSKSNKVEPQNLSDALDNFDNLSQEEINDLAKKIDKIEELQNNINKINPNDYINVNLDFALIGLILENPFFAELSRNIRKSQDFSLPTIGVGFDPERDEFVMLFNPIFISKLTKTQLKSILIHEFYHIIFEHVASRKKKPHIIWNIAADLAINSIIVSQNKFSYHTNKEEEDCFPEGAFVPGPDFIKYNKNAEKEQIDFFTSLKTLQSAEYYFDLVLEFYKDKLEGSQSESSEDDGNSGGKDGNSNGNQKGNSNAIPKGFDSHDKWDEDNGANKQLVKQKLQKIIEKAAQAAKKHGWGNIPNEIKQQVEDIVSSQNRINWKDVLRNFINNVSSSSRRNSLKRINRKYPYTHPGTIKNRVPKILVALDESGSITDSEVSLFFDELSHLTKLVSIDVVPFDCSKLTNDYVSQWKKGQTQKATRKFSGGTDFNAPTELANSEENRGRWDALIIFTDGCAPKPISSRVKRAWIIIPGYEMQFSTDELVVKISNEKSST